MNKKVVLFCIILTFSMVLSGCMGKEPNEIAYVVALGIDLGANENYKITVQYANTTKISGGESESGGQVGAEIVDNVIIEAPNVYAGVGLADKLVSKSFSMSHAKLIVFSREVAEKGIKDIIETLVRSEEIRPDVFIAVSNTTANEYLTSVNPVMEVNPAQYYQLIYEKNQIIGISDGQLREFFSGLYTGDYDSMLPIAGVISAKSENNGKQKTEEDENERENDENNENKKEKNAEINKNKYEYDMKNYVGGEASVEKENKSEAVGGAIFEKDKMVGVMGEIEAQMCKILKGDYTYSYITYYNNDTPDEPITVKVTEQRKPVYKIDLENKTVDINLYIESDIYSLPSDFNVENKLEEFESEVERYTSETYTEFVNNFTKKYNSDIFHLNERVKSKFMVNNQYNDFKKNVGWSEYKFSVRTNFKVRRTGLIVREF